MDRKRVLCAWLLTVAMMVASVTSVFAESIAESSSEFLTEAMSAAETTPESIETTEMPVTDPASTEPLITEAPATEPSVAETPATESLTTEPLTTEASVTEAPVTESLTTETLTTERDDTKPSAEEVQTEAPESSTEDESADEPETIEATTEEGSPEEGTEEEIPEDDIERILFEPMLLNLGDVEPIVEITSCRIAGSSVLVDGKLNRIFTTSDNSLYLFEEEMYADDIEEGTKPIASVKLSDSKGTFRFQIPLNQNSSDFRLYSKFFVGVRFRSGEYCALSEGGFITNPEALAANQSAYPTARNKKGILADMFWGTDLDELGVSHTNVNIVINELMNGSDISYNYRGKTYTYSASYVNTLDNILRDMQKNNIVVSGILLARPGCGAFSFPGISQSVGNYHGWNVVSEEGIECVSAAVHFLAERYGRSDNAYGHIANWIVGNEVNADTSWNYTGHQSVHKYAQIYANMLRITYLAVKSSCAHARVYMSLDMFWNNSESSSRYDGKDMVDLVNTYMKAEGDIAWGIAFHPYGNPLTEPEWWNDHAQQSENAGFISMQNLNVLTDYLQKSNLRDPDGSVKKVILSEQGYTSWSSNQGNVEWKQAAAYAYAYYVAEANPYVQAFTVMRQKDEAIETKDGLHQGMWYDNSTKDFCTFAKKPVWTVWKYIDTDKGFEYTDPLASIVGLGSFSGTYGSMMSSRVRSAVSGKSGYASGFQNAEALSGGWQAEYMLQSLEINNGVITAKAGSNSPFTYGGIVWSGSADFSSKPLFGFDFTGTAGADQNLRVRMRFTSGQNIYETEIAVKKNTAQKLYADLSGWSGKSAVNKIQIWVQQDGMQLWENGSFTISNVCKASGIQEQAAPSIQITKTSASASGTTGFDVSCETSGTGKLSKVEFTAWNVQQGTGSAVTVNGTVTGNTAKAHFSIGSFGNKTGAYNVRIVAYNSDGLASKEEVVSVSVNGSAESLAITNGYISSITTDSFQITVEARAGAGFSDSSAVAVWSAVTDASGNAQDDLRWYPLRFSDGVAKVTVSTASHKQDSGEYLCHAYVYDNAGNKKMYPMTATIPSKDPVITDAKVTDVTSFGYTVTCTFSCPRGLQNVQMPTWTDKGWQDDIRWYQPSVSGNTATLYVKAKDHGSQSGLYHTHIYVNDKAGKQTVRELEIKVPEDLDQDKRVPKIIKITSSEVTSSGYRVTAQFDSPAGVKRVQMPTWTNANGQDDLIWHVAKVSGDTASFYVSVSDHKKESGTYTTHVYVEDQLGRLAVEGIEVKVPQAEQKKLRIVSAKAVNVTADGYQVEVVFEAPAGVKEVVVPTWTNANGQDDLIWHVAKINGNTASFYVPVSSHKGESGAYTTHVYVRDKAGKEVLTGLNINVPKKTGNTGTTGTLRIVSAKATDVTASGYRVDVVFEAPAGVREVVVPTWTDRNGQDDLIWHVASVNGNTASFYVPVSSHKGESGAYTTHVYVRDKAGKEVLTGLNINVPAKSGGTGTTGTLRIVSAKAVDVTAGGYRVDVVFEAPAGVKEVLVPTWTDRNGQDDLIWHVASVSGNTASFYVPVSSHKGESGAYTTHVYVRDRAGKEVLTGLNINVPSASGSTPAPSGELKITGTQVSEVSANGYRVTATFSAPAGVKEVLMPSWSVQNGQDDVVWHQAQISGNTATCYIPISSHKNNRGAYITHVYLRDVKGGQTLVGVNATVK